MKYTTLFLFCSGLFWNCTSQNCVPNVRKLSMDSSMAIIIESTSLLSRPCLPNCWPRDFSVKKQSNQFIAYIWDSTYIDRVKERSYTIKQHKVNRFSYMRFDSAFYPLLGYLNTIEVEKITIQDVRFLSNSTVRVGLINSLKDRLSDNELGYLHVSPVVINGDNNKAVFIYNLQGEFNKSWIVSVNKNLGKWKIVNQYILGTS